MNRRLLVFGFVLVAVVTAVSARARSPQAVGSTKPLPIPGAGPWTAPVPSPDLRWVAFTRTDYRGISLFDRESGTVTELSDEQGAGYRFVWAPDSSGIAYRMRAGSSRLSIVFAHLDGHKESASPLLPSVSTPLFRGGELVFFRFDGEKPVEMRRGPDAASGREPPLPAASPAGRLWLDAAKKAPSSHVSDSRVFFNPVPSPDGNHFVVECLDGHVYLGTPGENDLEDLGPGSYPSFVRDGQALLLERTGDDGHQLVVGDLFLLDLDSREVTPLTTTTDRIERRPALGSDGRTIFYEELGVIYEGGLR